MSRWPTPLGAEPCPGVRPALLLRREHADLVLVTAPVDGLLSPRHLVHACTQNGDVVEPDVATVSLGQNVLDRDPALVRRDTRIDVVAVGADDWSEQLLHATAADGRHFGPLVACGPAPGRGRVSSGVAAACWDEHRTDVFAVGELGGRRGLLHWWSAFDEGMNGPELLPCGLLDRTPAVVAVRTGELHVLAVDQDGRLWHWHVVDGSFTGPFERAPDAARGVACALSADDALHVVVLPARGTPRHLVRSAHDGTWSASQSLALHGDGDRPPPLVPWRSTVLAASRDSQKWTTTLHDLATGTEIARWPHEPASEAHPICLASNEFQVVTAGASPQRWAATVVGRQPRDLRPTVDVRLDRRSTGFTGVQVHPPKAPQPVLTLTEWTWRIELDDGDRDSDLFVVREASGPGGPQEWAQEVLELSGSSGHQLSGRTLGTTPLGRPLLTADSRRSLTIAWSYDLFDSTERAPGVLEWFHGAVSGARPEPGAPALALVTWLLRISQADRYGRVMKVLSDPTRVEVPPIGELRPVEQQRGPVRVVDLVAQGPVLPERGSVVVDPLRTRSPRPDVHDVVERVLDRAVPREPER